MSSTIYMLIDYFIVLLGFLGFERWLSHDAAVLWLFICYALLLNRLMDVKTKFKSFMSNVEEACNKAKQRQQGNALTEGTETDGKTEEKTDSKEA